MPEPAKPFTNPILHRLQTVGHGLPRPLAYAIVIALILVSLPFVFFYAIGKAIVHAFGTEARAERKGRSSGRRAERRAARMRARRSYMSEDSAGIDLGGGDGGGGG